MNDEQRRAVESEICRLEDDIYRYSMGLRANPNAKTGNGVPFGDVIASLERRLVALKEGL